MKWRQGRRSSNVEDRRGRRVSGPVAIGGGGIGLLVIVVVALFLGVDPTPLLQQQGPSSSVSSGPPSAPPSAQENQAADFVSVVLADTEDTWKAIFAEDGQLYVEPTLVLFTDRVQSACGIAGAAVGPFYCQ